MNTTAKPVLNKVECELLACALQYAPRMAIAGIARKRGVQPTYLFSVAEVLEGRFNALAEGLSDGIA